MGDTKSGFNWSDGLGAVLGFANGFFNRSAQKSMNEANIAMQRETNELQHQMMQEQNDFNRNMAIEMFNMENDYNTPLAQVQRLREAGLNPAMMLGNGNMANTGDAMTPSGANVPTLTAPRVDKVPPLTMGLIDSLEALSRIQKNRSSAAKEDSETWKNYKKTDQEIQSLLADVKYKEALTTYQNLQTFLAEQFAPFERNANLKKLVEETKKIVAEASLAAAKGDTEKAQKDYIKVEEMFLRTQDSQLKAKFPYVLMTMRGQIKLLQEQAKTEGTKQELNRSSSQVNRGLSAIYQIQSELEGAKRDWMTNRSANEYGFPTESNLEKIFNTQFRQAISNLSKTDREAAKIDKEIDNLMLMARKNQKDLDWYEVERVWSMFIQFTEQNRKTAQTAISAVKPFSLNVDN